MIIDRRDETDSTQRENCVWGYASPMPDVEITVKGRPALTIEQAAARYGLAASSMRGELTRFGDKIQPVDMLDGRKPLYDAEQLDELMAARPGKDWRRAHQSRPSASP